MTEANRLDRRARAPLYPPDLRGRVALPTDVRRGHPGTAAGRRTCHRRPQWQLWPSGDHRRAGHRAADPAVGGRASRAAAADDRPERTGGGRDALSHPGSPADGIVRPFRAGCATGWRPPRHSWRAARVGAQIELAFRRRRACLSCSCWWGCSASVRRWRTRWRSARHQRQGAVGRVHFGNA